MDREREVCAPLRRWVPVAKNGQGMLIANSSKVHDDQELIITAKFLANRKLFGQCLALLSAGIFKRLGAVSGAFVAQEIPIWSFSKSVRNPGDVDLLIIPYSDGQLLLSRTVAVEVKIVRASYANPGKSPNKFGLTQGSGLLEAGFPNAALLHLITSNTSPEEEWKERHICTVLDQSGRVTKPVPIQVDTLPEDLLERSFGRLSCAIPPDTPLGFACAYVEQSSTACRVPYGKAALPNPCTSADMLHRIEGLFNKYPESFINIPCWPRTSDASKDEPFILVDRRRLLA